MYDVAAVVNLFLDVLKSKFAKAQALLEAHRKLDGRTKRRNILERAYHAVKRAVRAHARRKREQDPLMKHFYMLALAEAEASTKKHQGGTGNECFTAKSSSKSLSLLIHSRSIGLALPLL